MWRKLCLASTNTVLRRVAGSRLLPLRIHGINVNSQMTSFSPLVSMGSWIHGVNLDSRMRRFSPFVSTGSRIHGVNLDSRMRRFSPFVSTDSRRIVNETVFTENIKEGSAASDSDHVINSQDVSKHSVCEIGEAALLVGDVEAKRKGQLWRSFGGIDMPFFDKLLQTSLLTTARNSASAHSHMRTITASKRSKYVKDSATAVLLTLSIIEKILYAPRLASKCRAFDLILNLGVHAKLLEPLVADDVSTTEEEYSQEPYRDIGTQLANQGTVKPDYYKTGNSSAIDKPEAWILGILSEILPHTVQIEEKDESFWASALSCLRYFVCHRGKIRRSRLEGLDARVDGVFPIPCKIYGWMASLQLESLYLQLDCAKTPLSTTAQAPLGQSMSPGLGALHLSAQVFEQAPLGQILSLSQGLGGLSQSFRHASYGRQYPNLPVRQMMFEVRLTNTPSGFVIHSLTPVQFDGQMLHRLTIEDRDFIRHWLPYIESHVHCLPPELLSDMKKFWYCLVPNVSNEIFWATRFLRHNIYDGRPLIGNYWKETMDASKPFFEPGGSLSLDTILKNYPRGGIYGCDNFRVDVSQAVGNDISVRFKPDHINDIVLHELLFLFYQGYLVDHPETRSGRHPKTGAYYQDFHFKGN